MLAFKPVVAGKPQVARGGTARDFVSVRSHHSQTNYTCSRGPSSSKLLDRCLLSAVRLRTQQLLPTRLSTCQSASSTASAITDTALGSSAWQQFAEAASGEWSGISCTYNAYGELQEIPYQYVPSKFREWDMVPHDWHTQVSCLANDEGMLCTLKRLMPIVGCEADAVAYTEDERWSLRSAPEHQQEPKTVLPDGSYSIGPRVLKDATTARIEHCIARGEGKRARVVYNLKRWETDAPWKLDNLEVHVEERNGPYTGTPVLEACGYSMQTIGDTPPLDASDLAGDWGISSQTAFELNHNDAFQHSTASQPSSLQHTVERICLPHNLWAVFHSSNDSLTLEAGWLSSTNECRAISRSFDGERLSAMTFRTAHK